MTEPDETDDLIEELLAGVPVCDPDAGNGEGTYFVEQANETMHVAADKIAALREKLAVAREALEKVAAHCANTGYGNPIVNERIVDRCEETAKLALREINALTGGDNAQG